MRSVCTSSNCTETEGERTIDRGSGRGRAIDRNNKQNREEMRDDKETIEEAKIPQQGMAGK